MRQTLKNQQVGLDPQFNYRGTNQTRIETLSDASFALAMTLLVLSSSVPESFEELRQSMRLILPFGMSIALLGLIWYQHYLFFLKYGLQDNRTVIINTFLIFLILVYVYPLKFLTRFIFELSVALITSDFSVFTSTFGDFSNQNMQFLMIMYGLGAAFIFLTISWLYTYAYQRRKELKLNEYEIFSTRSRMTINLLMSAIPLVSALFSLFNFGGSTLTFNLSGFTYFLYPIVLPLYALYLRKKKRRLFGE